MNRDILFPLLGLPQTVVTFAFAEALGATKPLVSLLDRVVAAIATISVPSLTAQDGPQLLRVVSSRIQPEMVGEWQDLVLQLTEVYKKAEVPARHVWSVTYGPSVPTWITASPLKNFAELDSPGPLIKALGEHGYEQWFAKARKCVTSSEYMVVRSIPEARIVSERSEPPIVALSGHIRVLPGQVDAYALLKNDILSALRKAGTKDVWLYRSMFGGDPNEFTVVMPWDKMAEIDQ